MTVQEIGVPRPAARMPDEPERSVLCDLTEAVYRHAVQHGSITAGAGVAHQLDLPPHLLDELLERLVGLRLLRFDAGGRHYLPVSPDVAAAALISPLEGEIHLRRDLIGTIRAELGPLNQLYTQSRRGPGEGRLRTLAGPDGGSAALATALAAAEHEVIAIRPRGGLWEGGDEAGLARDLDVLARGVRLRVIYQHATRADLGMRAHARRIVAAGAEVRTTDLVPAELVVVDRECALVAHESSGAVEVSSAALAHVLQDVFAHAWAGGQEYRATEAGYDGIDDEILRDIARLLAQGLTDEVISRRLGMSVRACRRHVARLMKDLDAISRFQAGTRAARIGLIGA